LLLLTTHYLLLTFLLLTGKYTQGEACRNQRARPHARPVPSSARGEVCRKDIGKSTSRYTTHHSLLATHYLLSYYLPLTTHYPLLTTHSSLLTPHSSLLTTHYSLLTTHYLLRTMYHLLPTVRLEQRPSSGSSEEENIPPEVKPLRPTRNRSSPR
jgi:hypothetical protein